MKEKCFMTAYHSIPDMRICAKFIDGDGNQEFFFARSNFNYPIEGVLVKTCLVLVLKPECHLQEIKNLLHDITFEILFDDVNPAPQADNTKSEHYRSPVIEVSGNIMEDGTEADIAFDRLKVYDYHPCNIGVYPVISI